MAFKNKLVVSALLIAMNGCLVLSGCSMLNNSNSSDSADGSAASAVQDEALSESIVEEKTFAVTTEYGDLYYPEDWKDQLVTDIRSTDGGCDVDFKTTVNDTEYLLFTVKIGDSTEPHGTLTDASGTSRDVSFDFPDFGDISALTAEQQDQLYSMQEGINTVVENLK